MNNLEKEQNALEESVIDSIGKELQADIDEHLGGLFGEDPEMADFGELPEGKQVSKLRNLVFAAHANLINSFAAVSLGTKESIAYDVARLAEDKFTDQAEREGVEASLLRSREVARQINEFVTQEDMTRYMKGLRSKLWASEGQASFMRMYSTRAFQRMRRAGVNIKDRQLELFLGSVKSVNDHFAHFKKENKVHPLTAGAILVFYILHRCHNDKEFVANNALYLRMTFNLIFQAAGRLSLIAPTFAMRAYVDSLPEGKVIPENFAEMKESLSPEALQNEFKSLEDQIFNEMKVKEAAENAEKEVA